MACAAHARHSKAAHSRLLLRQSTGALVSCKNNHDGLRASASPSMHCQIGPERVCPSVCPSVLPARQSVQANDNHSLRPPLAQAAPLGGYGGCTQMHTTSTIKDRTRIGVYVSTRRANCAAPPARRPFERQICFLFARSRAVWRQQSAFSATLRRSTSPRSPQSRQLCAL